MPPATDDTLRAKDKWRPSLSMIVALVLGLVLLLPLAGVTLFRIYENHLVEATETELIAQAAAIAATTARRLVEEAEGDLPLGPPVRNNDRYVSITEWQPEQPRLDLTRDRILPERPDALPAKVPSSAVHRSVGEWLEPILVSTQQRTLAGYRLLDFNGVVIAGRGEVGLSLAHVEEVRRALEGRYASALRKRLVNNPQPIYSISRGTAVRVFVALPIVVDERVAGVVYTSRTPSNILKELFVKRETVFWAALFLLGATGLIGFIFVRAITVPIRALTERTHKIGDGDRDAIRPLRIHGSREIYELSSEMLDMSRKLYDRNDYINTFASHVTHELKTPLTAIRGAAELLTDNADAMSDAERSTFLRNILQDTGRATLLLDRLRALARADSVQVGGHCRLSDLVEALRERFGGIRIEWDDECTLPLSPENAGIVFENLIDNSAKHGAQTVRLSAERGQRGLCILVADDGQGVSSGNAGRIFDLFYTTRREAGGTGMGLVIVSAIIKAHDAAIALVPSDAGACFEIVFAARELRARS